MNIYWCYGCHRLIEFPEPLTECRRCGGSTLRKIGTEDDSEKLALARKIHEEIKEDLWG